MTATKKYRLGNQSQEYELKEDFLGWTPENKSWDDLFFEHSKNIQLISPQGETKSLFLSCFINKEAFPLSFFSEERAINWNNFAIVSKSENSEKFIIPLY